MVDRSGASPAASLARGVRRVLETVPTAGGFLSDWPPLTIGRRTVPRRLPVLASLSGIEAFTVPGLAPLVGEIAGAAGSLEWRQTYTAEDFGPQFLDRYGWTELVGLRGPIKSDEIACGLLLLGPDADYPAHAHQAEELYLPLAGHAAWMRGDEGYVRRPPGQPIHHPSWMPHATRTGPEPLLAIYVWRGGDLAAKSRIIRGSGAAVQDVLDVEAENEHPQHGSQRGGEDHAHDPERGAEQDQRGEGQ
jgi:hypothetical protein